MVMLGFLYGDVHFEALGGELRLLALATLAAREGFHNRTVVISVGVRLKRQVRQPIHMRTIMRIHRPF